MVIHVENELSSYLCRRVWLGWPFQRISFPNPCTEWGRQSSVLLPSWHYPFFMNSTTPYSCTNFWEGLISKIFERGHETMSCKTFECLASAAAAATGAGMTSAGFGTAGIVSGSIAAAVQSAIGNVSAGSLFSALQSFGALGGFVGLMLTGLLGLIFFD